MKKVLILIIMLYAFSVKAETKEAILISCVDGDTAIFSTDTNTSDKYRFISIDAPEVLENDENYGISASSFVCDMLKSADTILVEYDEKAIEDKYQRKLAWVWADKKLVQKEVVKKGYAKVAYVYDEYKYSDSLCKIQDKAIKEKLGLWKNNDEVGYCTKVDTNSVKDIIKYKNIKDISSLDSKDKKTYKTLQKVDDAVERFGKYSEKHSDMFTVVLFYIIVGSAIIFLIFKLFKDK